MSVKFILNQLELGFWDAFIPLMNKSTALRYFVPRLYRLFHIQEFQDIVKLTIILTTAGLLLGIILGVLH